MSEVAARTGKALSFTRMQGMARRERTCARAGNLGRGAKLAYFRKALVSDSVLILVSTLGIVTYFYLSYPHGFFWDLAVYQRAVSDLNSGIDPYRIDVGLPFVYHPLVLNLFAFLDRYASPGQLLPPLYAASTAWFAFEIMTWVRVVERAQSGRHRARANDAATTRGWAALLCAAAFGGVGVSAVLSGNLSTFMHFALIAAFLRSTRSSRLVAKYVPYVLVAVLSLIKPYFLVYLLIPTSSHQSGRARLSILASMTALFLLLWMPYGRIDPDVYGAFLRALRYQALALNDIGYSFFFFFRRVVHVDSIALILHALTSGIIFVLANRFLRKESGIGDNPGAVIFLLYFVLSLANPRMKEYDFFPALICFFLVLRISLDESTGILLAGLSLSWIPLFLRVLKATGIVLPDISGASGTWQIVGLAGLIMALACAHGWSRIIRS